MSSAKDVCRRLVAVEWMGWGQCPSGNYFSLLSLSVNYNHRSSSTRCLVSCVKLFRLIHTSCHGRNISPMLAKRKFLKV